VTEVRRARREDVPALSLALARAFADDPVASYIFPGATWRQRCLPSFFKVQMAYGYLHRGEVYTNRERNAVAMWIPPVAPPPRLLDRLAHLSIIPLALNRMVAARELARLLESHHPRRPHYYLGTLGTDPAAQNKGHASALLAPVLARCDRDQVGVYLECSRPDNVVFYAHHGFVVSEQVDAPFGGPRLWLMWREPLAVPPPTTLGSGVFA
jgi:GNAT superfamily N-acetyltransferase